MSATVVTKLVLFAALLAGSWPAQASPLERVVIKPGSGLRLSADELGYRPGSCFAPAGSGQSGKGNCLELKGKVAVELGSLRLRATSLSVELDQQGQPLRLQAAGGVELQAGEASGTARQASLQLGARTLELTGQARVRVRKLNLELEGERVELDLESGGLRVRSARARLELPSRGEAGGGTHARR